MTTNSGRSQPVADFAGFITLGLDLCVAIEKRSIASKNVHAVGGGVLLTCLVTGVSRDDVEALAQGIVDWHKALAPAGDTTCIFRDSAFAHDAARRISRRFFSSTA